MNFFIHFLSCIFILLKINVKSKSDDVGNCQKSVSKLKNKLLRLQNNQANIFILIIQNYDYQENNFKF